VCGYVSRLASVTATVKPEGAEIVGGDSAPPASILNVAGTRAPFGAGGEVRAEPGAAVGTVFVLVVGGVLVETVLVGVDAGVEAVVAAAVDPAARVLVDEVLPEPPHAASRSAGSSPRTCREGLTSAA
jgi:hypothetical protein